MGMTDTSEKSETPPPLGLLGGAFDPVHIGHLRGAMSVREELRLERVDLIPAAQSPQKGGAVLTSDYILPRVPSSRRGSLQTHEPLAQGAVLRPSENRSRVRPDRSVQVRRVRSVFLGRAESARPVTRVQKIWRRRKRSQENRHG